MEKESAECRKHINELSMKVQLAGQGKNEVWSIWYGEGYENKSNNYS